MPIVVALVVLWVGTLLDMASTYIPLVSIGDEFREANQIYLADNGDFLLGNFLIINAVFLLGLSLATMFALRKRYMVKNYIRETGLGAYAKEALTSKKYRVTVSIGRTIVFSKEELTSNLRKEDSVSQQVIALVSLLVLIGSVGGMRFLFFVNNLTEYSGYPGFMSLFLQAFPAVHEQIALAIVSVTAVIALYPITYLLLRLTAR